MLKKLSLMWTNRWTTYWYPSLEAQKTWPCYFKSEMKKIQDSTSVSENVLAMLRGGSLHKHLFRTQNEVMDRKPSSVLSMQGASAQARLLSVTCHHLNRATLHPAVELHHSYSVIPKCAWNQLRMTGGQLTPSDDLKVSANYWAALYLDFSSVKWELKQKSLHTFEVRTEWDHVIMCFL